VRKLTSIHRKTVDTKKIQSLFFIVIVVELGYKWVISFF